MSIDRKITRLTPISEPDGDRVPLPPTEVKAVQRADIVPDEQYGELQRQTGLLKRSGSASLETGNSFNGMPQLHAESRSDAQTSVGYPNMSGVQALDIATANVFRISLSGNATLSLSTSNWPDDAYDKTGGIPTGLEYAAVLKIDNAGGHNLVINADHWAPFDSAPDLSRPGYYEICITINQTPGFPTEVSAYPSIQPEEA